MIPLVNQMRFRYFFHFAEVHHHAVVCTLCAVDDFTGQCDLKRVAMSVQMPALALMFRNPVTRIELKAASDLHGEGDMLEGLGL